jgi:hypothetical protein
MLSKQDLDAPSRRLDREVRTLRVIAQLLRVFRWFTLSAEVVQALSDIIMTISDIREEQVKEMIVYVVPVNMCHWAWGGKKDEIDKTRP